MEQLLRVMNFCVSSDGIAAGEDQTLEKPFGHVDPGRLFSWAGAPGSPISNRRAHLTPLDFDRCLLLPRVRHVTDQSAIARVRRSL